MTQEIRIVHGTDRIKQLALRPDIAIVVRQIRAAMAEADRAHATGKSFAYNRDRLVEDLVPPDGLARPARIFAAPPDYSPISGLHGP